MKKKSLKKNYIYNVSYQLLLIIIPFITTPYLSRVLGADGVGLNSYATAMVSYFTLFACLGTGTYGQRAISYVQNDKEARSRVFFETFLFRLIMVLITLILYGIYLFTIKDNLIIYLILALNIVNIVFDITWFFQGLEEFQKTVLRNAVIRILNIIFIFVFVKDSNDLVVYVAGTVILSFLGSISLWTYLPKYVCKVNKLNPFRDVKTIIKLFIPTIAIQIYTIVDKTMLGSFANNYLENGYYEQAEKVYRLCLTLVTALGTVMVPRIGKTYKEGNIDKVNEYMYSSYNFIWFLAIPIMFGLFGVSDVFVPVFFGSGYEKVNILLPILSVLVVVIGLSCVNGVQYFIPIGKENIYTLTVVTGAVVNVILNLILIPKYFSIGASIASVVAETSVTLVGFIYIYRKKLLSIGKILFMSLKYFISGLVMLLGLILIKGYLIEKSLISLLLLVCIGAIIYVVMLFVLRDRFFLNLYSQAINIVRNLFNKLTLKLRRN